MRSATTVLLVLAIGSATPVASLAEPPADTYIVVLDRDAPDPDEVAGDT